MTQMRERGPFKVVGSREVYGNPWIRVREDAVIKPGGAEGIFGIVTMVPGVTIIPIDGNGMTTLVREFKYAIGRETDELPSGGIDENEESLDAAKRELREECGIEADEWTDLGTIDPFTTAIDSPNHLFLARRLRRVSTAPDVGEQLEAVPVPFEEAHEKVMRGEITHGASCVAILKAAAYLKSIENDSANS